MQPAPRATPLLGLGLALALVLLGLAMQGPRLGAGELHHEEARRALPAREMLASGDYAVPTIWGRPYLAKPPLYFWTVAAVAEGLEGGRVTAFAVRLPALLAAIATALLVFFAARRALGDPAAFAAGWAVLVAPEMAAKAGLGEIETLFTLLCGAGALAGVKALADRDGPSQGFGRALPWALLAGLATGLAFLAKGPLGLLFGLGPPLAIALFGPGRRRAMAFLLAALPLALLPAGLWYGVLLERLEGGAEALATFQRELGRGGAGGIGRYLGDRLNLVGGAALGWLPASLVVAAALLRRAPRAELLAAPGVRASLFGLLPGAAVLAVWPSVRARYALPLLPPLAFAAGPLLAALPGTALGAAAAGPLKVLVWLLLVAGGASALAVVDGVLGLGGGAAVGLLPGVAGMVALLVLAASVWPLRRDERPRARAIWVLVGLSALLALQADVSRGRDLTRYGRADGARAIEAALGGAALHTDHWGDFNLLFELREGPRWTDDPRELPPGAVLLRSVRSGAPEGSWVAAPTGGWDAATLARSPELAKLALWRRTH
ncbi:MAG: hypothetical protein GC161_13525 [Planctomycetaceae bacterium]|nr:hypothetical protein [Planctomycetaceae bacterium]